MMQGYVYPDELRAYNVDPFIAMMLTRSQDIAYSSINFDALIHIYTRMQNQELLMQTQHAISHSGYASAAAGSNTQ